MTDTAITAFKEELPCAVTSRMLIDMANSLDVIDSQLRIKAQPQGFFKRMLDSFTGSAARRDAFVAQHQQTSLRSLVEVTTHLTKEITDTNLALVEAGKRLGDVEHALAQVAHVVADQREALHELQVTVWGERKRVDAELSHMRLRMEAGEQLGHVFSRWDSGHLAALPLASRASAALQELRWGAFGQFLQQYPDDAQTLRETVMNKTVANLKSDARLQAADDPLGLSAWLALPEDEREKTLTFLQGLDWLGGDEVQLQGPQGALKLCSQWPLLEHKSVQTLPMNLPRAASPQRMASLLMDAALAPLNSQTIQGERA